MSGKTGSDSRVATPAGVVKSLDTLNVVLYGRGRGPRPPRDICQSRRMGAAYRTAKNAVDQLKRKRLPARELEPILTAADAAVQSAWNVLDELQYGRASEVAIVDWNSFAAILATPRLGVWSIWDRELARNFPKAQDGVKRAYDFPAKGKGKDYIALVRRNERFLDAVQARLREIARAGGLPVSVMFSEDGASGGVVCQHLDALVEARIKVAAFLKMTADDIVALEISGVKTGKATKIIAARDAAVAAKQGKPAGVEATADPPGAEAATAAV